MTESRIVQVVKVIVFELHLSKIHKHFHVETPLQDCAGGQPVLTGDIQS